MPDPELTAGERMRRDLAAADDAMRLGLALSREDVLFILDLAASLPEEAAEWAAMCRAVLTARWTTPAPPEAA